MVSFMISVQAGEHPAITSMDAVATHLGANVRDLYQLASETARNTSAALAARAAQRRLDRSAQRLRDRNETVRRLSIEFARYGVNVSRRAVEVELAKRGYVVPWQESKEVLSLVRRQSALAQVGARLGDAVSPLASGTS